VDGRFRVEAWTKNEAVEREIATSDSIVIAMAAFDAAAQEYPEKWLTLRQATRVIRERKPLSTK
jgi:hypothetical protein